MENGEDASKFDSATLVFTLIPTSKENVLELMLRVDEKNSRRGASGEEEEMSFQAEEYKDQSEQTENAKRKREGRRSRKERLQEEKAQELRRRTEKRVEEEIVRAKRMEAEREKEQTWRRRSKEGTPWTKKGDISRKGT